jgi:hypothetical protein
MNDKINEMWTALAAYQPTADAKGHGASWALMCSKRTERAANIAGDAAWVASSAYDAYAAAWSAGDAVAYAVDAVTYTAAYAADRVEYCAQRSIDYINKAQGTIE